MTIYVTLDAHGHVLRVQVPRPGFSPEPGALVVVRISPEAVFAPGTNEVGLPVGHAFGELGAMMRVGGILQPRPVPPLSGKLSRCLKQELYAELGGTG
jgi:hypothetical protein